jgi:hypothetical protein
MAGRVKRTYNLSAGTLQRVRELAGKYAAAPSQDAVVELAVDRLFEEIRGREEAALWAQAADDPDFRAEMAAIAADYGDSETWLR